MEGTGKEVAEIRKKKRRSVIVVKEIKHSRQKREKKSWRSEGRKETRGHPTCKWGLPVVGRVYILVVVVEYSGFLAGGRLPDLY